MGGVGDLDADEPGLAGGVADLGDQDDLARQGLGVAGQGRVGPGRSAHGQAQSGAGGHRHLDPERVGDDQAHDRLGRFHRLAFVVVDLLDHARDGGEQAELGVLGPGLIELLTHLHVLLRRLLHVQFRQLALDDGAFQLDRRRRVLGQQVAQVLLLDLGPDQVFLGGAELDIAGAADLVLGHQGLAFVVLQFHEQLALLDMLARLNFHRAHAPGDGEGEFLVVLRGRNGLVARRRLGVGGQRAVRAQERQAGRKGGEQQQRWPRRQDRILHGELLTG